MALRARSPWPRRRRGAPGSPVVLNRRERRRRDPVVAMRRRSFISIRLYFHITIYRNFARQPALTREMKIKPVAVAVLDESGHVKSLPREDGTTLQPSSLQPSSFSFEVRFPGLAPAASPLDKRVEHDRDRRSCWRSQRPPSPDARPLRFAPCFHTAGQD